MSRIHASLMAVLASLVLAGCVSSEPKVALVEQVPAERRTEIRLAAAGEEAGDDAAPAGETVTFVAVDIAWEAAPATVPAGGVTAELINEGGIVHTLVIEETGELIAEAAGGETVTGEMSLDPGAYTYYCDVPGHLEAGMVGELTVEG